MKAPHVNSMGVGRSSSERPTDRAVNRGETLAVIGGGSWGTTLAAVEAANFTRVHLFMRNATACEEVVRFHVNERYLGAFKIPSNVFPTTSLEKAFEGASLVLVAVPSFASREIARSVKGIISEGLPVVLATKGLERITGRLSIEVWREEFGLSGKRSRMDPLVLSGPNIACEIRRGLPAVSVLAGCDGEVVARIHRMIAHPLLSLVEWNDPLGAQAAGALKNVYAIGCGLARGLAWGDNVVAAMIWRGMEETARFVGAVGGDPGVMSSPAGIGDLVVTCTSPVSRNNSLGRLIAGGSRGDENARGVTEGAQTAQEARRRCRLLGLRLQLLESIWSVLAGTGHPREVLEAACNPERPAVQAGSGRGLKRSGIKGAAWGIPGMGVAAE